MKPRIAKEHAPAIILALIAGFIMLLPQILLIHRLGPAYQGIPIMKTDAEEHYLARMKEFEDNFKGALGNPYIYEGKGQLPGASYNIIEGIAVLPSVVFDIPVPTLNLIYKFVLPAISLLLLYALLWRVTGNRFWSLAGAGGIVIGYLLFSTEGIRDLLTLNLKSVPYSWFSRPIHPEVSSIFLFSYFHILLSFWRGANRRLVLAIFLLFSLSFYVYFYSFTFLLTLNVCCLALLLALGRARDASSLGLATVGGLGVGFFAFKNLYELSHHPYYAYFTYISNIARSHAPVVSILGLVALVAFLMHIKFSWSGWRERTDISKWDEPFFLALLATAFIVINQQVLTGVLVQEGHYHWYYNTPVYILVLFWLGAKYLANKKRMIEYGALALFLALSCVISIAGQYYYYKNWFADTAALQYEAKPLGWLANHVTKDDVVLANNQLSLLIPSYSHADVMWNYNALSYLFSKERVIYSLFLYMKLAGIKPESIPNESYFHPPVVSDPTKNGNNMYQELEVNILLRDYMAGIYPTNMLEEYRKFYALSWAHVFSRYKLDYIVWDKKKNPNWQFGQEHLQALFDSGDVVIYSYP